MAPVVDDTSRFSVVRLRYRAAFDAYQNISARNAETVSKGGAPSEQDLVAERTAATELNEARDAMMAARARLNR